MVPLKTEVLMSDKITQERLVQTVPEVGEELGICRDAACETARRGEIPSIRIRKTPARASRGIAGDAQRPDGGTATCSRREDNG